MEASKHTVFMYSGQGSQYIGMGRKLYAEHPVFKAWMDKGEALIQDLLQCSMLGAVYHANKSLDSRFDNLLITHPTILITQLALTHTLIHEGITPDAVLGVSLGELTGAVVAGALSFDDGVFLAVEKAKAVTSCCDKGGLTAVLAPISEFDEMLAVAGVSLAGTNFDRHFVIAGKLDELDAAEAMLAKASYNFVRLPVAYGFHSGLIEPAKPAVLYASEMVSFNALALPFISCTTGEVHTARLPERHFWHTMRYEMAFKDTFHNSHSDQNRYLDLGLYGTLAGFVKYNVKGLSRAARAELAQPVLSPMIQTLALDKLRQ